MILDAFHTGQNAAVWLLAFTAGFLATLAPLALIAWTATRLRIPLRARARIIEHRHRPTRHGS